MPLDVQYGTALVLLVLVLGMNVVADDHPQPVPAEAAVVAKFSHPGTLTFVLATDVALRDVSLDIPANAITVLFGPARAGKSTLLRCLNRLNDLIEHEERSWTGRSCSTARISMRPAWT